MPALSAFQRLPLLIADRIIDYYIPPSETHLEKQRLVLYNISNSWRSLIFQFYYRRVTIVASSGVENYTLRFPDKPSQIEADPALIDCVKEVEVVYQYRRARVGGIRKPDRFSKKWPKTLVFPDARSLIIDVTYAKEYYDTMEETSGTAEFMQIAQHIKETMPNIQVTTIHSGMTKYTDRSKDPRDQMNTGRGMTSMFVEAASMDFRASALRHENLCPLLHSCSNLVHLEFISGRNTYLFHRIARGSAATLEALGLQLYPFVTIKSFALDDGSLPVVYPRLRKFRFESFIVSNGSESAVNAEESVAVFPALCHLAWVSTNVFIDDLVFRGNSDTLEFLDITCGNNLPDILRVDSLFSTDGYPRLSHVKLRGCYHGFRPNQNSDADLKRMARLLSPATRFLSISDNVISLQEINDAVLNVASLENVQVLNIGHISMTFFAMLNLIKQLPNLARLEASSSIGYSDLGDPVRQGRAFVEYVYDEYYPLNYRLKVWILEISRIGSMEYMALISIVLAFVCPTYAYMRVHSDSSKAYLQKLKDTIDRITSGQYYEPLTRYYTRSVKQAQAWGALSNKQNRETLECFYKRSVKYLS